MTLVKISRHGNECKCFLTPGEWQMFLPEWVVVIRDGEVIATDRLKTADPEDEPMVRPIASAAVRLSREMPGRDKWDITLRIDDVLVDRRKW